MPKIKIEKIISFSSEDPTHVAANVLSNDSSKKWKCRTQGEKSASLVLQLEKASVISSVDVGNENSAYVEIQVTRSSLNDNFKMLLVMSSFMTPLEARQGTNTNKVRMFTKQQLSKPECDEKWDRVKVVCTQPFNRHVQYGLSFITFHSPEENEPTSSLASTLGKFLIRPDSPDHLSAGSLFARRKELQENTVLKAAAAIREASSVALQSQSKSSLSQKKFKLSPATPTNTQRKETESSRRVPRNRDELLYTKDEEEPNEKVDYIIEEKCKELKVKKDKEEAIINSTGETQPQSHRDKKETTQNKNKNNIAIITPVKNNKNSKDELNITPGTSKTSTDSYKRKLIVNKNVTNKKLKSDKLCKPFNQLLEGVVLVISGIQNPERANLRTIAMSMGVKYKSDWDNTCTHLICAFPNTPKFNQVKGKGKIITKKWLTDCNSSRKRLPWRKYALDKGDKNKNESEDEICELIEQSTKTTNSVEKEIAASTSKAKIDLDSHGKLKKNEDNKKRADQSQSDRDEDRAEAFHKADVENGSDTEEDLDNQNGKSGTDTEDEIERIQKLKRKRDRGNSDAYNVDTDEEVITRPSDTNVKVCLPDFFSDKTFYIDAKLNQRDKVLLVKYITAFNGTLKQDVNDSVDIIVSSAEFKATLPAVSSKVHSVSPDFVWECHNSQKLIPFDSFKL